VCGRDGLQRGATLRLLRLLLRCGRLRRCGQRIHEHARLLHLALDVVLEEDDAPLLSLVIGGGDGGGVEVRRRRREEEDAPSP
jgi:hypothetical protein